MKEKNKNGSGKLIAILVFVCVLVFYFDFYYLQKDAATDELTTIDMIKVGALYNGHFFPNVITSTFSHVSADHLISNMIFLILFGTLLKAKYNWIEMLVVFLLGALLGDIGTYFLTPTIISMGASGGILAWCGLLFGRIDVKQKFSPMNFCLVLLIVIPVYSTFASPTINAIGHVIGFLVGVMSVFVIEFLRKLKEK